MPTLRNRTVYRLPDGSEYLLRQTDQGYLLYDRQKKAWLRDEVHDYEVDEAGRIVSQGVPTKWTIDDLVDTGMNISTAWFGENG